MCFVAVKLEWHDYAGVFPIQEVKSLRQDADDLARFTVHDDVAAHDVSIAAKFAAPIAVSEHGGFGSARRIILLGEDAAQQRRHVEERESAVRDAQGTNLFGLGYAGHAYGVACIETEILESTILVAKNEVVRRGQLEFFELDSGGGQPDADKLIRFWIGQGLEEDAFKDAEDNRIGPYAGSQRDEGNDREHGSATEPSQDLFELVFKGFHALPPQVPVR